MYLIQQDSVSCEQVTNSFERVAVSSKQVVKSLEQVSVLSERIVKSFERVGVSSEQVTKSFEQVSVSSEWVTKSFERVGVSSERVTKSFKQGGVSSEWVTKPFERMQIFFEQFTNGCKRNPVQKWKVVRVCFPVHGHILWFILNMNSFPFEYFKRAKMAQFGPITSSPSYLQVFLLCLHVFLFLFAAKGISSTSLSLLLGKNGRM